jgi:RNA polymerase-binding transcription factor DksA
MNATYVQTQKRRLMKLRGRLRHDINRMLEAVQEEQRPPGEHERWMIPSESVDKEINLEHTEEEIRRAVNAALERIESGAYGECVDCGKKIPGVRLNAIPYVERCLKCEQALMVV